MTLTEGLTDLGSALGALQKASNIIKNWASFSTDKERAAKISELNGQILSAQTSAIQANAAQAALIEQVSTLKTEISSFETWDRERARYQLSNVGDGSIAYLIKPDAAGLEPPHWICPSCYENRKKSILQPSGRAEQSGFEMHKILWMCHACRGSIRVSMNINPSFEVNDVQTS